MTQNIEKKVIARIAIHTKDELLVVKRSQAVSARKGEWELPGGKLDKDENFEEAAVREAQEELGYKLDASELTYYSSSSSDDLSVVVFYHYVDEKPKISLSTEHESYKWVNRETWKKINPTDNLERFITDWFAPSIKDKKTTESSKMLRIFCDGGSRGNPGPSATGYVIYDESGQEMVAGGSYLGITTNNQAEYQAVLEAARVANDKYNPDTIEFYLDSQLVVNQMEGIYKIRNKDLWPVHAAIKETLKETQVSYIHVPRAENTAADAMVNQVLDSRKN